MLFGYQNGCTRIKNDFLCIRQIILIKGRPKYQFLTKVRPVGMAPLQRDISFSIDRGGTFTDVFAEVNVYLTTCMNAVTIA